LVLIVMVAVTAVRRRTRERAERVFRYIPGFFPAPNDKARGRDAYDISTMGLASGRLWNSFAGYYHDVKTRHERVGYRVTTLYFVRHGHGAHNQAEDEVGSDVWENFEAKKDKYEDPALTATGIGQARQLHDAVKLAVRTGGFTPELILVSPLTRAIETARISFESLWQTLPVYSLEWVRETNGKNTCDRRRTLTALRALHPHIHFVQSEFVADADVLWRADWRESNDEVQARSRRVLNWIWSREEQHIVIVSHAGFISRCLRELGFFPDNDVYVPRNNEMVSVVVREEVP